MNYLIRPIQATDNSVVAHIIRSVMTEFGAVGHGFSIMDPEVDQMYQAYQAPNSSYFVVEQGGVVQGCGGIAPLAGGEVGVGELKKMYFLPTLRGLGYGRKLIMLLEEEAKRLGYRQLYIETLASMKSANHLYQRCGYEPLERPLGNTGHSGCDLFYQKML